MTDRYNISAHFKGSDRQAIEEAVKKSTLPENVNIVHSSEIATASKPFAVIDSLADPEVGRQAYKNGAEIYASLTYDTDKLASELSS